MANAIRIRAWRKTKASIFAARSERCQSGRMGLSRKQMYPQGYRGFESLPLRRSKAVLPKAARLFNEPGQPSSLELPRFIEKPVIAKRTPAEARSLPP